MMSWTGNFTRQAKVPADQSFPPSGLWSKQQDIKLRTSHSEDSQEESPQDAK